MNILNSKVVNVAARVGISCFLLMMFGALSMFLVKSLLGNDGEFAGFGSLQSIFVALSLIFMLSVFVLWVEGWIWTTTGWTCRALEANTAIILFLGHGSNIFCVHFPLLEAAQQASKS